MQFAMPPAERMVVTVRRHLVKIRVRQSKIEPGKFVDGTEAISKDNVAFYAAIVAAVAATFVALLTVISGYLSEKRLRRRTLYGEAYRAAMTWVELVGRVRRRRVGSDADEALIERFHDLQEQILYHRGWIGSESVYMQRSFDRLVREVKTKSSEMIREGWAAPPMNNPSASLAGSDFPDATTAADEFLRDVRQHLSPWQLPKIAVMRRNAREMAP